MSKPARRCGTRFSSTARCAAREDRGGATRGAATSGTISRSCTPCTGTALCPAAPATPRPTTLYSYELPLAAAQTCAYACELTGDGRALEAARAWARHIRGSLPSTIGRRWRDEIFAAVPEAERLAADAIDKLGFNGWLKGHAGKPYHETTDGLGTLLCALVEPAAAFGETSITAAGSRPAPQGAGGAPDPSRQGPCRRPGS